MLIDILIKYYLSPENVWGLIWSIITAVCMCLIFQAWGEKWWKSLVPFYGTYIIYKNTWKQLKWLFLVDFFLNILSARSCSYIKKYLLRNAVDTIIAYIETNNWDIDISVEKILICLLLLVISSIAVFLLRRVTYMKICESLSIHNIFLKIGTFLFPQLFLIVDYIVFYKKRPGKQNLW